MKWSSCLWFDNHKAVVLDDEMITTFMQNAVALFLSVNGVFIYFHR